MSFVGSYTSGPHVIGDACATPAAQNSTIATMPLTEFLSIVFVLSDVQELCSQGTCRTHSQSKEHGFNELRFCETPKARAWVSFFRTEATDTPTCDLRFPVRCGQRCAQRNASVDADPTARSSGALSTRSAAPGSPRDGLATRRDR